MKKTFTPEEKSKHFQDLRMRWAATKELSKDEQIQRAFLHSGLTVSINGFTWIYQQMQEQGLAGLPVIDAKTFDGWKHSGFKVKKGEKSTLSGIVWVSVDGKLSAEDGEKKEKHCYPKSYHLFHVSQVEPINN